MRDAAIVGHCNFAIEHDLACLPGHVVNKSVPGPSLPIAPALLLMVACFLHLAMRSRSEDSQTTPRASAIALVVIPDPVFVVLGSPRARLVIGRSSCRSRGSSREPIGSRTASGSNQRRMCDRAVGAALYPDLIAWIKALTCNGRGGKRALSLAH